MLLKGKVGIVTGGSRGIGRQIVKELCNQGALVAFTFLKSTEDAKTLADEVEAAGGKSMPIAADVRYFEQARNAVETVLNIFGRLDFLVNNAGMSKDNPLFLMEPTEWQEVIETNLTGTFNFTRAAVVTFMKQRAGRIVNITSASGIIGIPRQSNYSASKAGIIGFTKAQTLEFKHIPI